MASSELLKYINDHVLECSICTDTLKQPKSLPCLHVFCYGCIETYVEKSAIQGMFKCPTCQEEHHMPESGVNDFRGAFLQKSLLDVSALIQHKKITCTSCEEDTSAATNACATCGDFLCLDCTGIHRRMRGTKGHDLTPIEELADSGRLADFQRKRYSLCQKHNKELVLYCNDDDKDLCHLCTFEPAHKGHGVVTMEAKLEEVKIDIAKTREQMEPSVKKLTSKKESTEQQIQEAIQREDSDLKEFNQRVSEICSLLKSYEQKVVKSYKDSNEAYKELLSKNLTTFNEKIVSYKKVCTNEKLMDSLPVASAFAFGKDLLQESEKLKPECELLAEKQQNQGNKNWVVISTLDALSVESAFRSVVGETKDKEQLEEEKQRLELDRQRAVKEQQKQKDDLERRLQEERVRMEKNFAKERALILELQKELETERAAWKVEQATWAEERKRSNERLSTLQQQVKQIPQGAARQQGSLMPQPSATAGYPGASLMEPWVGNGAAMMTGQSGYNDHNLSPQQQQQPMEQQQQQRAGNATNMLSCKGMIESSFAATSAGGNDAPMMTYLQGYSYQDFPPHHQHQQQ